MSETETTRTQEMTMNTQSKFVAVAGQDAGTCYAQRRVSHHCSECGQHVTGEDVCPDHPNATIDSVLAGPGRPITTGSGSQKMVAFRPTAAERARLESEAADAGVTVGELARRRTLG